jgi:NAD(P)-dependent dehydrogenase (short-subunit alcohol dehydrogenase family)
MDEKPLDGKTILITGGARRVGRLFALACGRRQAFGLNFGDHQLADEVYAKLSGKPLDSKKL